VEKLLFDSSVKYIALDAMLNKHDYCNGKWAVQFESKEDAVALAAKLKSVNGKHKLEIMNGLYSSAPYASTKNITNKTVRLKGAYSQMQLDSMLFFLEGFDIKESDVISGHSSSKFSHYFVHFSSSEMAQRFLLEKNMAFVNERNIHLVWYDV
jgi:hypothetical protein